MATIVGSQEADVYAAGVPTADTYSLLGGDDRAAGGAGDDFMFGGAGNDFVSGDLGNDVLGGGLGNDWVSGGEGDDFVFGGGGDKGDVDANTLQNDGNDVLDGGAGNDVLWGMGGDDVLIGGAGNDVFAFAPGEGRDSITDFASGQDKIAIGKSFGIASLDTNANGLIDTGDLGVTVEQYDQLVVTHIDFAAYGMANTVLNIGSGHVLQPSDFI